MTREANAIIVLTPQFSPCQELPELKKVAAIVMAGGRGKRMGTLCDTRPKPALPFGGNNRVIDFALNNCIRSGIDNIIVLVDYHRSYMSNYLKQWSYASQLSEIINIKEPQIGSYRGTADAVHQNLDVLHEMDTEAVLILAADHVYRMDYQKMFDFHKQVGADVTIGVVPVPIERAYQFGIVSTDVDDKIIDFQEKPEKPECNLASMGIYIYNTDVLDRHLLKDALDASSSHDFGYSVIPRVIKNERVFAYKFDGYWQDIGTPEAYYQAHMDLLSGDFSFNPRNVHPVYNEIDDNLRLSQVFSENIRHSIISENCVVNGLVEDSILSRGVFVAENATVRNAVVMAGAFIGYGSTVCGCIIDEEVEIGEYAQVGSRAILSGEGKVTIVSSGMAIPSNAEELTSIARR
jgi:glucose-1-phosphate adenylyltransferase